MTKDHDSNDSEVAPTSAPATGLFGAVGRNDLTQREADARLIEAEVDFAGNFRAGTRARPHSHDAESTVKADD